MWSSSASDKWAHGKQERAIAARASSSSCAREIVCRAPRRRACSANATSSGAKNSLSGCATISSDGLRSRAVANAAFACVIRSWLSLTTTRSASELTVLSSSRRERSTSSSSHTFSMATASWRPTSSRRCSRSTHHRCREGGHRRFEASRARGVGRGAESIRLSIRRRHRGGSQRSCARAHRRRDIAALHRRLKCGPPTAGDRRHVGRGDEIDARGRGDRKATRRPGRGEQTARARSQKISRLAPRCERRRHGRVRTRLTSSPRSCCSVGLTLQPRALQCRRRGGPRDGDLGACGLRARVVGADADHEAAQGVRRRRCHGHEHQPPSWRDVAARHRGCPRRRPAPAPTRRVRHAVPGLVIQPGLVSSSSSPVAESAWRWLGARVEAQQHAGRGRRGRAMHVCGTPGEVREPTVRASMAASSRSALGRSCTAGIV